MAIDPIWEFGAYATKGVTANVIQNGASTTRTVTAAELKTIDQNLDPHAVLIAMNTAGETLRYQVGNSNYTEAQIQTMVDNGRITLTTGGGLALDGTALDQDKIGYELQTKVIDKLQDEISQLNQLVSDLALLDTWLQDEDKIESDGKISFDRLNTTSTYYKGMEEELPNSSESDRKNFIANVNNDYMDWMGISGSWSNDPNASYRFATNKLEVHGRHMTIYKNDFSNAMEQVRNLVKEKSTQAEQLSTDFQSRNSRYNTLVEAMSSYASTFYDALKGLIG